MTATPTAWISSGSTMSRPLHQRPGLRVRAAARVRRAGKPARMLAPAGVEQILEVVEQRRRSYGFSARSALKSRRAFPANHRLDFRSNSRRSCPRASPLGGAVGHAEFDAHEETVELRFRQREGADLVLRILRREHEEAQATVARPIRSSHVALLHRLQQRALRLGRRPIDLIHQHYLRKERSRVENKPPLIPIEDRVPQDIRRQQIARKLDSPEIEPDRPRQSLRECRLPPRRECLRSADAPAPAGTPPPGGSHPLS